MTISTCTWVRSRLPLVAGGDSLGLDDRHVRRHLLRCPRCRGHLERLRVSQSVLDAVASEPMLTLQSLWPELSRQIQISPRPVVRSAWASRHRDTWIGRMGWTLPAASLAAGVLLTLGLLALAPHRRSTPASAGNTIQVGSRPDDRMRRPSPYERAQFEKGKHRPAVVYSRDDSSPVKPAHSTPARTPLTQ